MRLWQILFGPLKIFLSILFTNRDEYILCAELALNHRNCFVYLLSIYTKRKYGIVLVKVLKVWPIVYHGWEVFWGLLVVGFRIMAFFTHKAKCLPLPFATKMTGSYKKSRKLMTGFLSFIPIRVHLGSLSVPAKEETIFNRPFPCYLFPLFQNESWCTTFDACIFVVLSIRHVSIWKVVYHDSRASFWDRGKRQLGTAYS